MPRTPHPRSHRLNQPEQYRRVFENPCRAGDDTLQIVARRNECGYARLGLAVSKAAIKSAAARNRVKRVAREFFRLHRDELGNLDCVVLARRGADQKTRRQLRDTLHKLWPQLARCKKS
ncbi:MAG: ribonuclease P protein component [Gammaproteobacteria bacterium]|nr:ribonuclease P protein component [Gammaproteobacteria bacterium]